MTKNDWLNVAMIIAVIITAAATLMGPILAVYAQARISQPKPGPAVKYPAPNGNKKTKRRKYIVSLCCAAAFDLFVIIYFANQSITRGTILTIVFAAMSLVFLASSSPSLYILTVTVKDINEAFAMSLDI